MMSANLGVVTKVSGPVLSNTVGVPTVPISPSQALDFLFDGDKAGPHGLFDTIRGDVSAQSLMEGSIDLVCLAERMNSLLA